MARKENHHIQMETQPRVAPDCKRRKMGQVPGRSPTHHTAEFVVSLNNVKVFRNLVVHVTLI